MTITKCDKCKQEIKDRSEKKEISMSYVVNTPIDSTENCLELCRHCFDEIKLIIRNWLIQ